MECINGRRILYALLAMLALIGWSRTAAVDAAFWTIKDNVPQIFSTSGESAVGEIAPSLVTRTWDGGGITNNWSEAANWSGDTVPTSGDTPVFDGTSTKNATIDVSIETGNLTITAGYTGTISMSTAVNATFHNTSSQAGGIFEAGNGTLIFGSPAVGGGLNLSGGTFNAGSGPIIFRSIFNQTSGTFNGASGDVSGRFEITGGTFVAPSGNLTTGAEGGKFKPTTFSHNNGTFVFIGGNANIEVAPVLELNNLTLNKNEDGVLNFLETGRTVRVTGTLSLIDGRLNGSSTSNQVQAQGSVVIAPNFGSANSNAGGNGVILIKDGGGPRAIEWPSTASLPHIRLDDASVMLTVSGDGTTFSGSIHVLNGAFEAGSTNLEIGYGASGINGYMQSGGTSHIGSGNLSLVAGSFHLSGGIFTMDSGNATFFPCNGLVVTIAGGTFNASSGTTTMCPSGVLNGSFTQSNGIFNGGTGTIDLNYHFTLMGGTFNASSGNTHFGFVFDHQGGTFNHNNGTVLLDSTHPGYSINGPVSPVAEFHNLIFASGGQIGLSSDSFIANGTLRFVTGTVTGGTLRAKGNVIIESTAGGGTGQLTFDGAGSQTFTNNGGLNTTGAWTVNKPSGILTAASGVILGTSQALNVISGTLYLGNGSNLTVGALTIGTNGTLANDASTTITLGGNAINNGRLDLQGGGAPCPQDDTILLRSSVDGTRRNWSGTGAYRIADVDVKDMGGATATTPAITVFNGTDSGNNNTNWTFNSACPPELTISPLVANVTTGGMQQFTAGGGFAPRTFNLAINNSGASINPTTGLYTAGTKSGVSDTIRVTDNFGTIADATVNVLGVATQLAFITQPSNTTAGQTVTPPVQVAIRDATGNPVPNATNAVTLVIQNNPEGGTLSGTVTRNAVMGIATFDDLSIDRAANGYTLQASSPTLTSLTSNPFNINLGPPVRLGFITQPSNTDAFAPITPPVRVAIQDAAGNTVPTSTDVVNIAIEANPGSSILSGTASQQAVKGVATFDDLSMNRLAAGYTLRPQSGALTSAASDPFEITRPIFMVLNRNDSGAGSLRKAITDANEMPGPDTIHFNIAAPAPFRIRPATRLPDITESVTIDGTTQPGFAGSPIVELVGDLVIPSWNDPATGLRIRAANCTVSGLVISNFLATGIDIGGAGGSTVQGNFIGTDATGNLARPNRLGIGVQSSNNLIGGAAPGDLNLISGNTDSGVYVIGSGNRIQGNYIGTNANGTAPVPNGGGGIRGYGPTRIGGILPGEQNVIAFNLVAGVRTDTDGLRSFEIRGNSIHSNQGLGIDVRSLGVTWVPPISGFPSQQDIPQAFPTLRSAVNNGGSVQVNGSLWSNALQNFTIDFYSSPSCDSSGHGEGLTAVGSIAVMTNGDGNVGFIRSLPGSPPVGHFLSATATRADGSTSEFSPCQVVVQSTVSITGRAVEGGGALANTLVRLSGARTATAVTNSNGDYAFTDLPSNANYTVTVSRPNYDFTPPSRTYTNVITDRPNQDYTGVKTRFTIAGQLNVVGPGTSMPLASVRLTLSGTVGRTINASGVYFFNDLPPGQYTVTPSKDGYTFSPPTANVTISNLDQTANFAATPGSPLPGRLVYATGVLGSINADGTGQGTFLSSSLASMQEVSLTRDGRKIAFTRLYPLAGSPNRTLFIGDADGSNEIVAIQGSANLDNRQPEWSPDGTRIAFVQISAGRKAIRIRNSTGTVISVPTQGLGDPRHPTWLSNTRLAFSATPAGTSVHDIFAVNTDGTGLARLTTAVDTTGSHAPAASPNGNKIAFFRLANPTRLMVMDSDGGNPFQLRTGVVHVKPAWSPDGTRLVYRQAIIGEQGRVVVVNATTGQGTVTIIDNFSPGSLAWGPKYEFPTAAGNNVETTAGGASVRFGSVVVAGTTTFTPMNPTQVSPPPSGYVFGSRAYEISTTAAYTAPVTVCVRVPASEATTAASFNAHVLMHSEGGVLVDRTISRNLLTRTICAQTTTLSPFVLAQQRSAPSPATGGPLASISGTVVDSNGTPLSDVLIQLTGTESRITQTDATGTFDFVNLTEGGSYNVRPGQVGYLFAEPSHDFIDLQGDNAVAFVGTQANFSVGGRIRNSDGSWASGVLVNLEGASTSFIFTDANGDYSFADLAAEGTYSITPIGSGFFNPPSVTISPLTGNAPGVDFVHSADATEFVALGGQVVTENGYGIGGARILLTDSAGEIQMTISNPFGYYQFDLLRPGVTYTMSISQKQYQFHGSPLVIFVTEELTDVDFRGTQ